MSSAAKGEGSGAVEAQFLSRYPLDTPVVINGTAKMGGKPLTLGFALAAEAGVCPADLEVRSDPRARVARLALMLYEAGNLAEDHLGLLPSGVEEG
jgi:hypothetical protein